MDLLSKRIQKAAESVLENEGLVSGLDESTAALLQDWGIKNVKRIAEETGDLSDEHAEEAMYPKMKASRRLMRAIRVWVQREKESSQEEKDQLWLKLEKMAQALYGEALSLPSSTKFTGKTSVEFIRNLLDWLENNSLEKKGAGEKKTSLRSLFNR
ncbi:MAG: hypothetical protein HN390_14180 [Anaerolineae bacterium]|jgi:hypothetical protein|nr:hypothetical protein [Anaerolineae bacterium]MBT7192270.1 hypothetical protein [Anaerolineae bacterium]MBT7990927.1 hypothetical protein [Anaerolineae bacterium]